MYETENFIKMKTVFNLTLNTALSGNWHTISLPQKQYSNSSQNSHKKKTEIPKIINTNSILNDETIISENNHENGTVVNHSDHDNINGDEHLVNEVSVEIRLLKPRVSIKQE